MFVLASFCLIVLQSNKDGHNMIVANNPTTAGCSCHGPAVSSTNNVLKVEVLDPSNNPITAYVPNTNYTVRVILSKNNANNAAGFQATIFNSGTSIQAGTPSPGTLVTADNIGGTVVANHSQKDVTSLKVGNLVTWEFPWKSPLIASSNITVSVVANDANDDDVVGGDAIVYQTVFLSKDAVGVKDYSKGIDALYPNPTSGKLVLDLESAKASVISISSITGQLVKQLNATGNKVNLDVSELNNGNYIISIAQDGNFARQQFVKF